MSIFGPDIMNCYLCIAEINSGANLFKIYSFSFSVYQALIGVGIGTCCGNDSGNCVRYVDLDFTGVKSRRLMASRWS